MKINIVQLKKEVGNKNQFNFITSADKVFAEGDTPLWLHSDIQIHGYIINNGRYLDVSGTIEITADFECNRCLEDFTIKMPIPFSDEYCEDCSNDEEDDFASYCGDEIDITDLVRESILLAEPLKPMCSENCRGLCQGCGVNLNVENCSCKSEKIDPRLAVLKQLLK